MNELIHAQYQEYSFTDMVHKLQKEGKIDEVQVQAIESELVKIAHHLVLQYNHKRSSTISLHTYKQIHRSILYALDHVHTYKDNPSLLQANHIESFYQQGFQYIEKQLESLKHQALRLEKQALHVENERYQDVLHHQFFDFIKDYHPAYKATLCKQDFDYPLLDGLALDHQMYGLVGLDLAQEYANRFDLEQQFCHLYENQLETLVRWYELQKGISVHVLGLNVMELLLRQQLFACLLPNPKKLLLTKVELEFLAQKITNANTFANLAYKRLQNIINPEMYTYSLRFKERFIQELQIAINHQSFASFIIYEMEDCSKVQFQVHHAMDNDSFLDIVEQIEQESCTEARVQQLLSSKASIHDVLDILDMSIFNQEEYEIYFCKLDSLTLALLFRYIYPEEFLFQQTPTLDTDTLTRLESAREWYTVLKKHLGTLDAWQRQEIEQIFQSLK
ncbi:MULTISPECIES: DUF6179 domain-containing protein [unclassified Breznakia]|uniref:DUF6179 domain-containing protein n=1 Tax=unclassified Breznakia TaxID=2623764 RepID=UPI002473A918|nr:MULTISPECIES: DUF6179 domain-containing protein [unclassified Breznakia]MDH6366005.1 hypothetical protein [Breznakia sp. PH1-1]MDH6403063.1 hypothetical protein [Breznakia sp. PF1-11]MDH6410772.1 hypothetical protein [Breznakia sp. PFB1-11]MDH6413171.1 hypothetical protein [Breznakia sp. PFB1-14]MDH6415539.1 hypothetical protein [Breznakia sp. PFB1-4]